MKKAIDKIKARTSQEILEIMKDLADYLRLKMKETGKSPQESGINFYLATQEDASSIRKIACCTTYLEFLSASAFFSDNPDAAAILARTINIFKEEKGETIQ
jgi:hypothetical protein